MDSELESLKIDRSKRSHREPSAWATRWIIGGILIFVLLGAGRFVYGMLNAATKVETVRVASPSAGAISGLIGCILVLPLNNIQTSLGNFITFSETSFSFRVTPTNMLMGVAFAIILGAIGGIFPARMATKKEILNALREV